MTNVLTELEAIAAEAFAAKSTRARRKNMRYEARYYGQTSSARLYTGSGKKTGFTKKPTADEQLNEKPTAETPKSSDVQPTNS